MSDEIQVTYTVDDLKTKKAIDDLAEKCSEIVGWSYNSNDSEGYTPLCFAAMNGIKPDKIVYLINNKGCNPSRKCGKGKTPLQCAILSGCSESVDTLIGRDVYEYDDTTEEVIEDTNKPSSIQPKFDADGNKVPLRDKDDSIVYKKDSNGVEYPLNPANLKDPESATSEVAISQLGRLTKDGSLVLIPPIDVDYKIIYKYEDDGTHSPMRNSDGDPIKQCNVDGTEIHKKDEFGKYLKNNFEYVYDYVRQPEYDIAYNNKTTKTNKIATVSDDDLCEAAKLSKPDILKSLGTIHKHSHSPEYYTTIVDKFDSTLLYSACIMSCYESVRYILDTLVEYSQAKYIIRPCGTDESSKKSALNVAIDNEDEQLAEILSKYLTEDVLPEVFEAAFANEWHTVINTILLTVLGEGKIYKWLSKSYQWDDSGSRSIAKYIDVERNTSLYKLLLANYSVDKLSYFINDKSYNIIAFLYKENVDPFDTEDKFNILLTNSTFSTVYDGVIAALFNDEDADITLTTVCNIVDDVKRNKCIDKIFTLPYSRQLLSSLIDNSSLNRDAVLAHIYLNGYFTLQNLSDMYSSIADYDRLSGVIRALENDPNIQFTLQDIQNGISYNGDFKMYLIIDMLKDGSTALEDIELIIPSSDFKNRIIIEAFTDPDLEITVKNIITIFNADTACSVINRLYVDGDLSTPNDIYDIYNSYYDGLSALNDDLKPYVGTMKYSNKAISTDYFWAYKFTGTLTNWYNPQLYHSNPTQQMQSDSLQDIGSDKYISVKILNGNSYFEPSKFRLSSYQNAPSFYIDDVSGHIPESDNGIIIKFSDAVTTNKFDVPIGMMYSIDQDSNEITWNKDHILYRLLQGDRCYLSSSSAINHAPIVVVTSSKSSGHPGEVILLRSSDSIDPDGDEITFKWSGDHANLLSSTDIADPSFTIPSDLTSPMTYEFTITVTDSHGAFSSSNIYIDVAIQHAPVITVAETMISGSPNDTVILNASISDPDGDDFSYSWSGSASSQLVNRDTLTPSFTIPENASIGTTYRFTITAIDTYGKSSSKSITVKVELPAQIGTLAFATGSFAVDLDPGTIYYTTKKSGAVTLNAEDVKYQWQLIYSNGYRIPFAPKSPYYTNDNKVFIYDLLYKEDDD